MDAAHHGGVQRCGGNACIYQGRAAGDGGQARSAPRAGSRIAQQSYRNGHDRVKAQRHQKRSRNGCGSARTRSALQKNGNHQTHHDQLHPAVIAGNAGHGVFHVFNRAGLFQSVENHERSEYHGDDFAALLDPFPEQRVIGRHILLKGKTGHVEIGKRQNQRPNQRQWSDLHRRFLKCQNPH
ncbi:hypothetical protein DSECCO2_341040 [anaerobic digester metagenome]